MRYFPGRMDEAAQNALLDEIRRIITVAPLFTPTMPRSGKPTELMEAYGITAKAIVSAVNALL